VFSPLLELWEITWNCRVVKMLWMIIIAYMLIEGVIVGECIYVKWWVDVGELLLNMCMIVSYVHAFIVVGYLYPVEVIMMRCWWRYHMHVGVVSRSITCCGMIPSRSSTWCLMWMVIGILWCCELLCWRVFWSWMLLLINWS